MTTVRVRLFAALRELAGASEVEATGLTVGEVVAGLSERYGERFANVARAGSVVVDGERADADRALVEGDEVALLPPVSGGARPSGASWGSISCATYDASLSSHNSERRFVAGFVKPPSAQFPKDHP